MKRVGVSACGRFGEGARWVGQCVYGWKRMGLTGLMGVVPRVAFVS
jgi:hypothetical protein